MQELLKNSTQWLKLESDPRVDRWFLMSSPVPSVLICLTFLIVAKLLHIWMKPLEAVKIRWPIWGFDFFHLTMSASFILVAIKFKLLENLNLRWVDVLKKVNEPQQNSFQMSASWRIAKRRQNCTARLVVFSVQFYVFHGNFHFSRWQKTWQNNELFPIPSYRVANQYLVDCKGALKAL